MKTLLFTIAYGPLIKDCAAITVPLMQAYAERIGADFKVIDTLSVFPVHQAWQVRGVCGKRASWEKLRMGEFLETYDRAIFIDADAVIREDCPSLFDIVPEDSFAGYNEVPWHPTDIMVDRIKRIADFYGLVPPLHDGTQYLNSGVLVASKIHRDVFKVPKLEYKTPLHEQDYINLQLLYKKIKVFRLPWQYHCLVTDGWGPKEAAPKEQAFIRHYASGLGCGKDLAFIKADLETCVPHSS